MYLNKTLLQKEAPKDTSVIWAVPDGDSVTLMIHVDGVWRPINGSGGSSSSSSSNSSEGTAWPVDPDAPMLTASNFYSIFNSKVEELSIDPNTVTEEQMSQLVDSMSSVKFATPKQGNAVLTNVVVEEQYVIFTFQCDDGSYITFNGETFVGLRPDLDGYIIWKTTMDKLPVRGSQEETDLEELDPGGGNTPKSVKSGSSLKVVSGEGTKEVYTVINNNTGEIVDPLELHKLTNVIWYDHYGVYYPFYLQEVADFYSHADAITNNDISISTWVSMGSYTTKFTYIKVALLYDYTLQPSSMSKIQTTNNTNVSDINSFFNY